MFYIVKLKVKDCTSNYQKNPYTEEELKELFENILEESEEQTLEVEVLEIVNA